MPESQVSATQSSVAVQQAPRLHDLRFNHAPSTFSTRCNPRQSPVPYSPITYLTNRGNGQIYPTIEKIKDRL